ncbi:hypothetical protein [Roseiflexus sp.]|uniref:hypothetical protein n=1 Tax=Roseiflexus sp. TaxID=2562120 RepID=UPI0021DEC090|nr:hypothetical protein [Roseiflexus sp.]GIV98885.1 MAG: hypothetical protein KatS3mg058_0289 [Roseiflexus sp.]
MMLIPPDAAVAAVHTTPATVADSYRRLLTLVGIAATPRRAILIPRYARSLPFPGAGATPWQLETMTRLLLRAGVTSITAVLPARHSDMHGYTAIAAALGIDALRSAPQIDHETLIVVLIPCRIDRHNGLFGATPGVAALFHSAAAIRNTPHTLPALAQVRRRGAQLLAVADATTISDGRDAETEYAEVRSVLLASRDPAALDATIAAQFGLDPLQDVAWLHEAHRQGWGTADLHAMAICGDVEALNDRWGLATPSSRRAIGCCRRWTTADATTLVSWLRHTGWGRLFRNYQTRYALHSRR